MKSVGNFHCQNSERKNDKKLEKLKALQPNKSEIFHFPLNTMAEKNGIRIETKTRHLLANDSFVKLFVAWNSFSASLELLAIKKQFSSKIQKHDYEIYLFSEVRVARQLRLLTPKIFSDTFKTILPIKLD